MATAPVSVCVCVHGQHLHRFGAGRSFFLSACSSHVLDMHRRRRTAALFVCPFCASVVHGLPQSLHGALHAHKCSDALYVFFSFYAPPLLLGIGTPGREEVTGLTRLPLSDSSSVQHLAFAERHTSLTALH